MADFTSIAPSRTREPIAEEPPRRPLGRPALVVAAIAVPVVALVAGLVVWARTATLPPGLSAEDALSALLAIDATLGAVLLALVARAAIRPVLDRRRALPLARYRGRLTAYLLGMTIVPATIVLIVGGELVRTGIDRWFNAPMAEVVSEANTMAGDYYQERQRLVSDRASRGAAALESAGWGGGGPPEERAVSFAAGPGVERLAVYRVVAAAGAPPSVALVSESAAAGFPEDHAAADRLAAEALGGATDPRLVEPRGAAGDLVHAAAVVHGLEKRPVGVVVATGLVAGEMAARSRRMTQAFEGYNQLRVLRQPLTAIYLSFFVMVTLLTLIGAAWTDSYLAGYVTRPVLALSAAAREIGAGRLDRRIDPQDDEEFGALADSLATMAGDLAASRRKLERSNFEIERKHLEAEKRRRSVETILERIATGVVTADTTGALTTINAAASRLLNLPRTIVGHPARLAFDRADLRPLGALLAAERPAAEPTPQEVTIAREGQELRLAVVATTLVGESGAPDGVVLVFDDVTPLIRAQKVAAWREVARRLAHEIKNPLTPIQLSAERLRRHFQSAPETARTLVEECTDTIVGEVESLKGLVDEFSQFARMPAPKTVPADLAQLVTDTLALYGGLFADVRLETELPAGLPLVRLDPEQIRRVLINLVDNAIEAMNRRGTITVAVQSDAANNIVRLTVADDGPGIPAAEREKLFLPYYSTKRRGSGLGLAIVRRIIAEHGGSIEVGDNLPRGTRFTIELPS